MSEYIYATIGDPVANALGEIFLPRCEVVRCRDCRYSINDRECSRPDEVYDEHWFAIDPDGFCAWGERRDA